MIQAVLHPLPADDLLPFCPRGHARRVILRRKIKSEHVQQPAAKTERTESANPTHVEEVRHHDVRAPAARRPGVGAAAPNHLGPVVLHLDAVRTYQPVELIKPIAANRSHIEAPKARCDYARTWGGVSRAHLGSRRGVSIESDEEESDAVEQVVVEDFVVRAGRGHGGEPGGVRVSVWGFFVPELVPAWLTGEDSRAGGGQEEREGGKSNWDLGLGGKSNWDLG